jgi:uncharacterized protein (DUF58 family)
VWAALILAVPAAFWPYGPAAWAIVAVAALAVAAVLDRRSAPAPARLRPSLEAPDTVGMGQPSEILIRLHNPGPRPIRAGVHVQAPPELGLAPARQWVSMPAESWGLARVALSPTARGYATLGPLTLRVPGRWGVAGRQARVDLTARIKIYPPLPGRREVALRLNSPRFLTAGIRPTSVRGEGTDFDSLREYHRDDEFRRINWRATARAGKPISNIYREERNQRVLILVDAGRTMATSIDGASRFELAIDSCVALAELAGNLGDQTGMLAFAKQPIALVGPRTGRVNSRRILDQLFDVYPTLEASNYQSAFSALLSQFSRRALLVLLTELTEPGAMQTLFQAMPALVTRHLVVVGSVIDPLVLGLSTSAVTSSEQVYRKAAAQSTLDTRATAALRLRSMGATVIDTNPGELPGRLADEYLRIKARGRL